MSELVLFFFICFSLFLFYRTRTLQKQMDQLLSQEQLEQALDHFVEEIKQDNDALIEQLVAQRVTQLREEENGEVESTERSAHVLPFTYASESPSHVKAPSSVRENEQQSWHQLLNEGYSATEIAKRLHMGVTEVELLIAFNQKKKGSNP